MPAFLALLHHIHNTLSPTLHTPILLISQTRWTSQNLEHLTTFFFEKFKTPAFCIMESGLAISYGLGVQTATVVDVGFEKCDITAVSDFLIQARSVVPDAGGEAMTRKLMDLLGDNWTRDMAEQLKRSHICEVLTAGTPLPGTGEPQPIVSNPAAAASTGATASGPAVKIPEAPPTVDEGLDDDMDDETKLVDEEGVLDVVSIVAGGKTQEFLAQKAKEKAERAAARKVVRDAEKAAEAAAAKPVRLPNSKRLKATFWYEARKGNEDLNENGKRSTNGDESTEAKRQKTPEPESAIELPTEGALDGAADGVAGDEPGARREQVKAARKEERRKQREGEGNPDFVRRDYEVGTERFLAATDVVDNVADAIHRTVLSVDDISKRAELWESLVIVGNGAKIRGE